MVRLNKEYLRKINKWNGTSSSCYLHNKNDRNISNQYPATQKETTIN